ncbi:C45 family autoproteolytic acyltransferase/hydolase [Methanofollis aquaemaris]|nr:C45 family peptidase [Methanofollis aquaemaris]
MLLMISVLLSPALAYSPEVGDVPTVTDEVVLQKEPGTFMEVRHIVVAGTNEEIGSALGKIAQDDYGVSNLSSFSDRLHADARREYLQRNAPVLYERMLGVASAYGVDPANTTHDTSGLPYDLGSFACSMIYYPPNTTTAGHAMACRNMDYYMVPVDVLVCLNTTDEGNALFSRTYVMELYPDEGYASLAVGSMDLMSGVFDGVNSAGLGVATFAVGGFTPSASPLYGGNASGLNGLQMIRSVLDQAATVDEAKMIILNSRVYFPVSGMHFMVYDRSGNASIVEIDPTNGDVHFTDAADDPFIMTNHAVFRYPDASTFPEVPENKSYNTFHRHLTLADALETHHGLSSPADAEAALARVYAHADDDSEGAGHPFPIRTLWNVCSDLDNGEMTVKFYLRDGPLDPATGDPTLVFSEPFTFGLRSGGDLSSPSSGIGWNSVVPTP